MVIGFLIFNNYSELIDGFYYIVYCNLQGILNHEGTQRDSRRSAKEFTKEHKGIHEGALRKSKSDTNEALT